MKRKPTTANDPAELRRRAEARLREQKSVKKSDFSTQRLLHELEVHRIELEMQNAELRKPGMNLKCHWRRSPTSTILPQSAISPLMNRA
jgi:hypothetical protein